MLSFIYFEIFSTTTKYKKFLFTIASISIFQANHQSVFQINIDNLIHLKNKTPTSSIFKERY